MSHSQPTHYSFLTQWQIQAPLEKVWDVINNSTEWPVWWKGFEQSDLVEKGNDDGTGQIVQYSVKSFLPFTLSFDIRITEKDMYKKITGQASGDLEGTGIWTFEESNGITYIQYKWDVVSSKKIINLLSPAFGWFFRYNHNLVMHWGAKRLAKKLHAQLLKG